MNNAVYIAAYLTEELCESKGPRFNTLKKNKRQLTPDERKQVMDAGAVWHFSSDDHKASPAIWKSVVDGKTWYSCHTHRCFQVRPTLKGAIKAFEFVKTTA